MSQHLEIIIMWGAVTAYAFSTVGFVAGLVFGRERIIQAALWIAGAGLVPHTVAAAGRWIRVGHGPYLGFYEVVSSYAYISVIALLLIVWRYRSMKIAGAVVMPLALLLLGAAMLAPKAGLAITPKLASWWLVIHVAFAKLAYGSFIAGMVLGLVFVFRERLTGPAERFAQRLPDNESLDDLMFRVVAVGFILLGIMIGAGAIWANEAWGRYWGWDPIETWSLISWLVYAALMHARLTMGWRGRRFAWAVVWSLLVALFALIGVPIVYESIHAAYLGAG